MRTTLKPKTTRALSVFLVTMSLSLSCSDPMVEQTQAYSIRETDASDPLYQHIVNDLGFDPADVLDYGEMYIAEGDIMFNKSYYEIPEKNESSRVSEDDGEPPFGATGRSTPNGKTAQHVAWAGMRVTLATQSNILISIHSNMATSGKYNLRPSIQAAIDKFNQVICSNIRFQIVTNQRGHIQIIDGGDMTGSRPGSILLDLTDAPSGGAPGRTLRLNVGRIVDTPSFSAITVGIIMHSLAHAIGFRHTNPEQLPDDWPKTQGDVQVPNTPKVDASSVFNAIPAGNNFSSYDNLAIANAYPSYIDAACLAPFYYYWSSDLTDAFYTTQLSHKGEALTPGWKYAFQKIECYIHTVKVTGTVPLYRMWSQGNSDHAYKLSSATFGAYHSEGVAGYIYSSSAAGRVGFYEFYNSARRDYAYTINPDAISSSSGYVNQGLVGYVYRSR